MANYNNYQQVPFWDFIRSFEQHGAGVDHPAGEDHPFWGAGPAGPHHPPPPPPPGGFHFGGPEPHGFWGRGGFGGPGPRGGRRGRHGGRHGRRGSDNEDENERSRSRTASPSGERVEDEECHQSGNEERRERGPRGFGRHASRGGPHGHAHGHRGRGGPCGMGGRGGFGGFGPRDHYETHHGGPGYHGRRGPPPPSFGMGVPGAMGSFDLGALFDSLNSHPVAHQPWAQTLRQYAQKYGFAPAGEQATNNATRDTLVPEDAENSFIPPIDVFSTETAYVLHIALPGAKKEDVGVNWDADKGSLNVAGVVYRQGDEEFLKQLSQSERKVGVFDRSVKLPPGNEEKEEVDGEHIVAKLEDGVLVVTVPKVEREWTEVKRVDIE